MEEKTNDISEFPWQIMRHGDIIWPKACPSLQINILYTRCEGANGKFASFFKNFKGMFEEINAFLICCK